MSVRGFRGLSPRIHGSCFIEESARLVGDVEVGEESSVWFGCVLRGDVQSIRVGRRSNIQDLTLVHVRSDGLSTEIGDDVTVGHRVILHGCRVGSRVLVGMGAIVLDGAVIEDDCIIAAGALVPPGATVAAGSLVMGSPGKVRRVLSPTEREGLLASAASYVALAREYRART